LLILKDNAGTQSLSDYLKEHADDPQAVSALIDSLFAIIITVQVF
jgi:hypothetical protein